MIWIVGITVFADMRAAIEHYLSQVKDRPQSVKFSNLYHRLGRIAWRLP
jgi:hypothetical protein